MKTPLWIVADAYIKATEKAHREEAKEFDGRRLTVDLWERQARARHTRDRAYIQLCAAVKAER